MIKVLNILTDSNIGGAGRCLINYLKYCDRDRFSVQVVLPRNSKLKPEVTALNVPVIEADGIAEQSFSFAGVGILKRSFRRNSRIWSTPMVLSAVGSPPVSAEPR